MNENNNYVRKIGKDLRITMPIGLVKDLKCGYIMPEEDHSLRIINESQLEEFKRKFEQESDANMKRALHIISMYISEFSMDDRNRFKISLMQKKLIGAGDFVSITKTADGIKISATREDDGE